MRSSLIPSHVVWVPVQGSGSEQNSPGAADSETELFSWKTLRKMHGFTQVSNIAKGNVVFVPFKENSNMVT